MLRKIVLICNVVYFVSQLTLAQNSTKSYNLNNSCNDCYGKSITSQFSYIPLSEGKVFLITKDTTINGVIDKFILNASNTDRWFKNKLIRKFERDYFDVQFSILGQSMTQNTSSALTGLEVEFIKKRGKFKIHNIEKYNEEIKELLKNEIPSITNKPKKYLKKVRLNEVKHLNKNQLNELLQFGTFDEGSGSLELIKVETRGDDTIAIVAFTFKIKIIDNEEDNNSFSLTFDFKGTY
ncbi:hypothetical protein [Aureibaculum marinum]|uniref:hypothetical protein n=1 Tax=Aureibaculum marinum TaxID=2487930 RepID=UPI000F50543F|nr:hypothetical protein [Aureibaculum marinum]